MIISTNPYNSEILNQYPLHTASEIDSKLSIANNAYKKWKSTPLENRIQLLQNVAKILRTRKQELAELVTSEMGKLIGQSIGEIEMCASVYEYYANNAAEFLKDKSIEIPDGKAYISHEPIGIILAVMPWNFPFNQVARLAAPNIVAGNVIVLKHASIVPGCAQMMEEIFREAGADEGIFSNLFIPGNQTSQLANDPRIKGLSLTGSEGAGSSLAESAGRNLKKSVLELGGSDAFIVLEDADIKNAIQFAIKGRFANMGQACTSAKRIILRQEISEEFIQNFIDELRSWKFGNPMDKATKIGPLSSVEAAKQIRKQVNENVVLGAKILYQSEEVSNCEAHFPITVLTDVTSEMPAFREEIFGPIAMIYKVDTDEEAISLANATDFGLGGAVFSQNIERAETIAKQMETGMVFINENLASRPDLPFGGVKRSGYGRELSALGIEEFLNRKVIRIKS